MGRALSGIFNSSSNVGRLGALAGYCFWERGLERLCSLTLERFPVPMWALLSGGSSCLHLLVGLKGNRDRQRHLQVSGQQSLPAALAFLPFQWPDTLCSGVTRICEGETQGESFPDSLALGRVEEPVNEVSPWLRKLPENPPSLAPSGCRAPSPAQPSRGGLSTGERRPRMEEAAQGSLGSGGKAHGGREEGDDK